MKDEVRCDLLTKSRIVSLPANKQTFVFHSQYLIFAYFISKNGKIVCVYAYIAFCSNSLVNTTCNAVN